MKAGEVLLNFSRSRTAWAALSLSSAALLGVALYFQYYMQLAPCVMCVYQRAALMGVILAGILGWLSPRSPLLSHLALGAWLASSIQGAVLAYQHHQYQLNPSPFAQCTTVAEFPTWLALDSWLPSVFAPSGDCSAIGWSWMSVSMVQWLLAIFITQALLALFFILVRVKATLSAGI
ncbi:disulfide bond formation protein DsbB [Oceanisphaera avium]|uniref:Disulfide bond formation protein B n=1 Tax=Oceanisphaera avium TaxID=1903694 RepID=A0A1Y0CVA8_9GAMM|nr:disulfide bond formation protein DsbB [Oceanisphaera avium]ART79280.1 disulfide bond formation protein B [Oceanisphaera avium]